MERFLDFQFKKEVRLLPLFLNQSFRAAAVSLLSLFSSVYIYKTLLVLTNKPHLALFGVFVYFLGVYSFKLISTPFAEELSLRLGLKKQIYFGLFFSATCLFILVFSLKWPLLLFFASPFWGLSAGFYWFGRHGLMVKIGQEKSFGKELGIAEVLRTILLLGVPFLGGVLISLGGYAALFLASLFFVFLSFLVVGPIREEKTYHDTTLKEVLGLFKTHKGMFLAYMGHSAAGTIYRIAIPLYLFLILKKELSLGEFFSLSMIVVALINLMVGRWVDLKGKKGVIAYGSIFQTLVWLGRRLTQDVGVLFTFDIIDRITGGMVGIPLGVLSYQKALDGHSTGRALLFRELSINGGAILSCCLLALLAVLKVNLQFSFLAAAFFSLLPLLIVKRWGGKNENTKE